MSDTDGEMVIVKQEYDSDVDVQETSSNSSSEIDVQPAVLLTTNYHDPRLPTIEDFAGPLNFSFTIPREETSSIKASWEYSDLFKQVFIKMDRVLVVQFRFNNNSQTEDLFIRALLVFSCADYIYSSVNRCAVHAIEADYLAKAHADKDRCLCPLYGLAGHVVRCKSNDVMYCYDPTSERHSVLCPVRNNKDILYSFSCKSSCPRGINRRSTRLVFTLENSDGNMLGKSSINVKICSCPRRDKEKMEQALKPPVATQNKTTNANLPPLLSLSSISELTASMSATSAKISKAFDDEETDVADEDIEDDEEMITSISNLPGEVIMKIKSEIRNIRQALSVIERRFSTIQDLITTNQKQ